MRSNAKAAEHRTTDPLDMKKLFTVAVIALSAAGGFCQEPPRQKEVAARIKAERAKAEREKEATNVLYFKPRVITSEWSVVLATIKKLTPETTEKLQIDQHGKVTLSVRKVFYGKKMDEVTLPYRYNHLAVFKIKDLALRRRFEYTNFPDDLVWPDLTALKKRYLLVVINPHAYDPFIMKSEATTMLAAKVVEVSGDDDSRVLELLNQIEIKQQNVRRENKF